MAETNQLPVASLKSRRLVKFLLFVLVVASVNIGGTWLTQQIEFQLFPRHDSALQFMVLGSALLYVLLMTIPFMPGIEIGLALMILLGNKGALLIYLCTVLALAISFIIGRRTPPHLIVLLLNWFHLHAASALVAQLESLDPQQRLKLLYQKAPRKLAPFLLRHRYLAIVAILNLPGNALIGGGGGIGVIAGMSKIFPFYVFILIVAVAVLPVPLLFYFEVI
ncbi:hypothetical protein N8198_09405 [Gammaproteobacteria bacterium]|nr:hypothetical protein [Gammaproteobacteria bacterium]